MSAREVDNVTNVIAELRRVLGEGFYHLVGNIGLKLSILDAAGVSQYIEDHLAGIGDVLGGSREIDAQVVVIWRQAQRFG